MAKSDYEEEGLYHVPRLLALTDQSIGRTEPQGQYADPASIQSKTPYLLVKRSLDDESSTKLILRAITDTLVTSITTSELLLFLHSI